MDQRAMRMNEIWQIRVRPVCCGCRPSLRRPVTIIRVGDRCRSTVVSTTEISCQLTRVEAFEVRLRSGINSATKRCPSSAAILSQSNSNSPSSVNIAPPVATVSSPAVAAPPDSVATALPDSVATAPPDLCRNRRHLRFSSTYHLFNVFHIRHVGRKIVQCSPNKDGGRRFEYTA